MMIKAILAPMLCTIAFTSAAMAQTAGQGEASGDAEGTGWVCTQWSRMVAATEDGGAAAAGADAAGGGWECTQWTYLPEGHASATATPPAE